MTRKKHNGGMPQDLQELETYLKYRTDTETGKLFSDFLAASQNPATYKKVAKQGEISLFGGALSSVMTGLTSVYNPDEIPISTYEKMRKDAQIAAGLAVIMMPPLSLSYRIESNSVAVKSVVDYNMRKIYRRLLADMLTSVIYGFYHGEKIFSIEKIKPTEVDKMGKIKILFNGYALQIQRVKANHPDTIELIQDKLENLDYVIQNTGFKSIKIPREKTFLFSHQYEFGNYYGISRLKPCYKPWYWGELIMSFMLMYLEKMGTPITVVRHPVGIFVDPDTGTEVSAASYALKVGTSVISNSVVTLPSSRDASGNFEWDLDFKQSDPKVAMFGEALKFIDNLKLRGLYVPERVLTQDVSGTGAYGLADVHTDVFFFTEGSLITDIEDAINNQIIPDIVNGTFPEGSRYQTRIKIEQLNWNRKGIFVDMFRNIINGMFQAINNGYVPDIMPNIKQMGEEIGIPISPTSEIYSMFKNISDDVNNNPSTKLRKAIAEKEQEKKDEIIKR